MTKNTDKATASAPETRIADLKGHINYDEKLGCWCIGDTPIDPQQRTIPAEKPTARHSSDDITRSTLCQFDWNSTDPEDIKNARLIVASVNHADKLAEACASIAKLSEGWTSDQMNYAIRKAQSALAAYEASTMKYSKNDHAESLNELEVPFHDQRSNGGRIPDNVKYGDWLRRNDPIAFNVSYNETIRDHEYMQ